MDNTPEYSPTADSLLAILRRLRAPDGCPWDRRQTRDSLKRHLVGEVAELLDALDRGCPADICEELGDVLMNLLFQVVVAGERGEFSMEDVWRGIIAKMIRRHEHVFGSACAETPEEVAGLWQQIKAREHGGVGPESVLDRVPRSLSALDRAAALQRAASEVGFDWPEASGVMTKIEEECGELRQAFDSRDPAAVDEELGDLLFAAVNLTRFRKGEEAEALLRSANRKFESRFRYVEQRLKAAGEAPQSASPERLEELWQEAKRRERQNGPADRPSPVK